ncbi:toxin-antitoxin system, antitoxin component [Staphylococcus delphini]|uniref:Toxin-antitoxin system, antitoxin component n=2 Tax=Staphylococcus delphini TaxID=53344 RepID=A0A2A4GVX1_9STAP|nr:toxin-antitoxin system, antitoxin component [Staphylococcus delphini]PCF61382.1 toxin-antitoxin system, antitoxin component [Staphylococcus delphini]PCF75744.1 toxin-antitoxin system, antitoxin component [Staphylococcus delphini]HEC2157704.1 toxin-antitoxin system, antitoxin component [Staphylococcus delphini]
MMTTVRMNDDEKKFLEFMAEFLGLSLSEVIKQYTFEDLEDIYDAKVGDEALIEYREIGQKALYIEDVMKQWNVK